MLLACHFSSDIEIIKMNKSNVLSFIWYIYSQIKSWIYNHESKTWENAQLYWCDCGLLIYQTYEKELSDYR